MTVRCPIEDAEVLEPTQSAKHEMPCLPGKIRLGERNFQPSPVREEVHAFVK